MDADVIGFRSALPELTLKQCALLLKLTERHVRRLTAREIDPLSCKRSGPGKPLLFQLDKLVRWMINERLRSMKVIDGAILDLEQERALLAREQRLLTLQTRQTRATELVPQREVLENFGRMVVACRSKMLGLPSRLGGSYGAEVAGAATTLVHEALNELAAGLRS